MFNLRLNDDMSCVEFLRLSFKVCTFLHSIKYNPDAPYGNTDVERAEQAALAEEGMGGRCFIDTANFAESLCLEPEHEECNRLAALTRVVHGVAWSPLHKQWILHGWLEMGLLDEDRDPIVLVGDYQLDEPIPRGLYYEQGRISPEWTLHYELTEAQRHLKEQGQCGPWDEDFLARCHQRGVK